MSAKRINDDEFIDLSGEDQESGSPLHHVDASAEHREPAAQSAKFSIVEPQIGDSKFSVDNLQQYSQYLHRESSSRYQALVLNTWTGNFASPNYEVGIV